MRHAGPLPSCTGAGGPVARARRPLSTSLTSISMVDAAASSSSPPPKMHPLRPSLRASAGPRDAPRDRAISARRQATPRSDDDKDGEAAARNASSSSATTSQNRRRRRPRLRALVVVEGPSDARAVLRAVDLSDGCHSLGGATWARNRGAMDQLVEAAARALLGSEEEGGGGKGKAGEPSSCCSTRTRRAASPAVRSRASSVAESSPLLNLLPLPLSSSTTRSSPRTSARRPGPCEGRAQGTWG